MASVALLKTKTIAGDAFGLNAGASQNKIGAGGTIYYIKAERIRDNFYAPAVDLTGDGDARPYAHNSGFLYGKGQVTGYMLAGTGIGLTNMIADNSGTGGTINDPAFLMNTNIAADGTGDWMRSMSVLVERIQVRWRRSAPVVWLGMSYVKNGKLTEADGGTADAMASHTLASPPTHTTAVFSGDSFGEITTGADPTAINTSTFAAKLWECDIDIWTRIGEVTGAGDADPVYRSNLMLYGNVVARGFVPADITGSKIGIDNMIRSTSAIGGGDDTDIDAETDFAMTINLSTGDSITMPVVVNRITTGWSRKGASTPEGFVPVEFHCTKSWGKVDAEVVEA